MTKLWLGWPPKREKTQRDKTRKERKDITIDFKEAKRIIEDYYE